MFKRNKNLTLIALVAMLFMAVAVTFLSFSHADEDIQEVQEPLLTASNLADGKTNIDNIINNSYVDDGTSDPIYKIVEIGSGPTLGNNFYSLPVAQRPAVLKANGASNLSSYVEGGNFEKYVINGNKFSEKRDMNTPDMITYEYYKASLVLDEDEAALEAISNADLIYISNDASCEFSETNDISEELYNILHTYGVGKYKPIIIDKPQATSSSDVSEDNKVEDTLSTLAGKVFDVSGLYYYTFAWDSSLSVSDFLQHKNGSLYLGINGNSTYNKGKWSTIKDKEDNTITKKMANFLIISKDGDTFEVGNSTMAGKLFDGAIDVAVTKTATDTDVAVFEFSDGTDVDDTHHLYDVSGTTITNLVYNKKYRTPDFVNVQEVSVNDVADVDFDNYDMIIIDSSCNSGVGITNGVYKKLASAMYGSVSIIYDKAMSSGSGEVSGGTSGSAESYYKTNFEKLFYSFATSDFTAKFDNIMITTRSDFDIITTSSSTDTAKIIADLINNSSFRGMGGAGSSDNKYTVLELQPCYPIDLVLAGKVGEKTPRSSQYAGYGEKVNYYTTPGDMVDNKTYEQIYTDEGYVSESGELIEYYKWELSPAKIAAVTGLSVDQINVVHMSTEEFAVNKTDVLGTYDLIYIGGDTSALKSVYDVGSLAAVQGSIGASTAALSKLNQVNVNMLNTLPYYGMYSHNGDMAATTFVTYGGVVPGGRAATEASLDGVSRVDSFSVLNGNDISYSELQSMKAYVNSGMPVVISEAATMGYNAVKSSEENYGTGYYQNLIDPDCNMYKFLDYCMKDTRTNVLSNFQSSATYHSDNNGGDYGTTLTGWVELFASESGSTDVFDETKVTTGMSGALTTLLTDSSVRPKITVTGKPTEYNEYDTSTRLPSGTTLKFTYNIVGSSPTVELYIDDNGNSVFEDTEVVTTGSSESLEYPMSSSFYGPLYWQLKVTTKGGMVTTTTGLSYIKNATNQKQSVNVLQIMPGSNVDSKAEGPEGTNTLYFCPVCQQAYRLLNYNPSAETTSYYDMKYKGNYKDKANGMSNHDKVYLGKHEHTFGIVKYDSREPIPAGTYTFDTSVSGTTGADDWTHNLADDVSDLYDFDIDIMKRDDFEKISRDIAAAYDFSNVSAADAAATIAQFEANIEASDEYFKTFGTGEDADGNGREDTITSTADLTAAQVTNLKLKFITQRNYEKEAARYWQLYQYMATETVSSASMTDDNGVKITATTFDQEKLLRKAIEDEKALKPHLTDKFDEVLNTGYYFNIFSIVDNGTSYEYNVSTNLKDAYSNYITAKDKELDFKEKYKENNRLSYPDNWLLGCYDTIVIGASEDFAGDDITDPTAIADLHGYIDGNGQVLLFHDTLSKFGDAGTITLTDEFKDDFGINKYHMELNPKFKDGVTGQVKINGLNYELKINGATVSLDNTSTASAATINISSQREQYWDGYKNNISYEGSMNGAGDTAFNVKVVDYQGNPMSGITVSARAFCYWPAYDTGTFTATTDANGEATVTVPNYQTKTIGLDEMHYLPYVTTKDPEVYFMTNLSTTKDDSRYASWMSDMQAIYSGYSSNRYLTSKAASDLVATADKSKNLWSFPYKYADVNWEKMVFWRNEAYWTVRDKAVDNTQYGTNRASKNNDGIITIYPFTLSDELYISGTHSQAYALDIEDPNMTVWYSFSGTNNDKGNSSAYAADPRDGNDNYFIYTYNNVNYCGAGHSKVTGVYQENNDERRLYINIICNSVRKSAKQPAIFVYDYEKDTYGDFIKRNDSGEYYAEVEDPESYPEFSYKVNVDDGATLSRVRIYYDLDYSADNPYDDFVDNENQVMIAIMESVNAGTIYDVGKDGLPNLKLKPEYFENYNNEYTYIVIEATDSKGNKVYQRIKIKLLPHLFELT